ncbi:MAG: penicillin-binding protein 2 [Desulfobacterales bacterium]|nr:MAG: penicillin-binding protein 2 [Desulfobacterales bacterium]
MTAALEKYLKTADHDWYKQRLLGVMVCALAAFVVLFVRLIYLQVIMGDEYRRLSLNNRIRLQDIEAPRGLIHDRNGDLLVDNRPSFDVSIILKDAAPLDQTIAKLSRHLDMTSEDLFAKIKRTKGVSSYQPIVVKQDIGRDVLAAIEVHRFDLPGVDVNVRLRRHYLNEQSSAHLIGYLSEISSDELKSGKYEERRGGDFIGKFGAEKAFENYLQGKRGGRQVEVNANGQVVRILKTVAATPGQDIYMTIDQALQKKAEALLEGQAGALVAMEPTSGRILALASSPSFDQNIFVNGMSYKQWDALIGNPYRPLENKAIQAEYPPGSTYKIITALAGLQEGIIDADTVFHCPGHYRLGNRVFRCWKRGGHGKVHIIKAIAESCDVFFYQVGRELGVDRLAWYAKAAGLGARTGINLDREAPGLIPTAAWKKQRTGVPWQEGETLSIAIGQGFNLATPLQMAVLTAAVANGGVRYSPQILQNIVTADGQILYSFKPQVVGKLPVSKANLELVRKGLWEVVNGKRGTARQTASLEEIDISGKTGTAQVFSRKGQESMKEEEIEDHLKSHAWFVAYAPSAHPKIAVTVIVEHGAHGSTAAAPVARELIKAYLIDRGPDGLLKAQSADSLSLTQ